MWCKEVEVDICHRVWARFDEDEVEHLPSLSAFGGQSGWLIEVKIEWRQRWK